jgi:hypothetical protein
MTPLDYLAGSPVGDRMANTSPQRRRSWPKIVIPVALMAVLLLAGGTYTAINLPRQCGLFGAARHGLVCAAPIPSGAVYQNGTTKDGVHTWSFIDSATSYESLHDFFARQLRDNGWRCLLDSSSLSQPRAPGGQRVVAIGGFAGIKSGQVLSVSFAYGTLSTASPQTSRDAVASMRIIYGLSPSPRAPSASCAK